MGIKQKEEGMVRGLYAVYKSLGYNPLPPSRRARLSHLYPDRLPEAVVMELDGRRVRNVLLCLAASAGTAVIMQFFTENTASSGWMIALGLISSVLLFLLPEQRMKEAEEERKRELEQEYSELVSQLCVLIGAGLTVRGAWERLVGAYREQKERTGKRIFIYEEMDRALHSLGQGISEEQMYINFGRRCGLPSYLRLGGLLESYVKTGMKGFEAVLAAERDSSFRERIQMARKQGEEISVKLLLPMLMLFGLVAAMLVIPAFLSI